MPLRPGTASGDWSIVGSPNTSTEQENALARVTCESASDCWAVGYYFDDSTFVAQTLIEHWDGTSWAIVSSPNTSTTQSNFLRDVTCVSASECWAVGNYTVTGILDQTLIERWDGTSWAIVPSPNANTTVPNYLYGVTCVSASECWAVGYYISADTGVAQTLTERWDGTSWAIVSSPNTSATQVNLLNGVTCVSPSDCWAVGYYDDNGVAQTLIERWDGTSWSIVSSPNTSATQHSVLNGVTCVSASECWAVGKYTVTGILDQTLIERWDGTSWSIVNSPNTDPTQINVLFGVTCVSPSDCWAVGYYFDDSTFVAQTLIERWDGTSWAIVTSPNTSATQYNYLLGVTCASASDCWAVGFYFNDNFIGQTLVSRYTASAGPDQPVADTIDPASGPETGGTVVTVTGDNFVDGETSIHIGTETVPAAEVTVISPTDLEFTTPAHAPGVVGVTVETPGGVSDPPLDFEYTPGGPGQPVATEIDPDHGPETGGTEVCVSGENFVAGQTSVHIGSNTVPADEVDVIDSMTLCFVTPPHPPGVVDVTVETPGGTSDPPLTFEYEESGVDQRLPAGLQVDFSTVISDGNLVFEPGERVEVAPEWLNDGPDTLALTGTAADFTGPAGPTYTLVDADSDYGTVDPGALSSCRDTANCYEMEAGPQGVPRPAQHWDTTFDETLSEGTEHSWTLHIGDSFLDAAPSHLFYRFIETIFHHGITLGCTSTDYCPGGASTRAQMAVFVLRGAEGADFTPPPCAPGAETFDDVPASNTFCPWIEELEERGVVAGCGGDNYCPGDTVTRNQMAVFLLRALLGSDYTPPVCSGIFTDVTCPSQFADWIEDLFQRGITEGCTASEYCPEEPNTRGQMAAFLTRTFGLALYGP